MGGMEGGREGGYPSYPSELDQSGDLTSLSDFADELPASKKKDLVIHVICFGDFNVACVESVKRGRGIGKGEFGRARNSNNEFWRRSYAIRMTS